MSQEPTVLTRREGHIYIITLNRPQSRNAVDLATARLIEAAMDEFDEDDSLFVGVITGAGEHFCAGADLKAAARGESGFTEKRGGFGLFGRPPAKPLIAAVEGFAVGGGFETCLSCDIIVAAETAQFGLPEVRHNVVAVGGGLLRLPQRMPYHLAIELALTGEFRNAAFFERWGVVNRVVPKGQALAEAIAFAHRIMENGPTAVAASKEIIFRANSDWAPLREGWQAQREIANKAIMSEDRVEGLRAFAENRKPVWTGR